MAAVPGGNTWTNSDGLRINFGRTAADANGIVGSPPQSGEAKTIVVDFTYADFGATGTETFIGGIPRVCLPAGKNLMSATLEVTTAFTSGGSATLTIGTASQSGTTLDADGIDATIAVAAMGAAAEITCDGALIDTTLASDSYLTWTVGTAAFTAGAGKLIIKLLQP